MSLPETKPPETKAPVVRLRNVSKYFPGVHAVDGVDLEILPGEVHVVAGENGAGKSSLMKLLSQVERPSGGEIEISGEPVRSEERRVGKECRSRWSPYHLKKKITYRYMS